MATEGEALPASLKAGYSVLCAGLVLFGGMMSGLTLGLLSLDRVDLAVRPSRGRAAPGAVARPRGGRCRGRGVAQRRGVSGR